jgi:hypothetical protein
MRDPIAQGASPKLKTVELQTVLAKPGRQGSSMPKQVSRGLKGKAEETGI